MGPERSMRPVASCLRCTRHDRLPGRARMFATSFVIRDAETEQVRSKPPLDPYNVRSPRFERKLMREQGKMPIGSRRRRAAMHNSLQIPFSQLPYQCFQEARAFLQEDRAEKLEDIRVQRGRIERLSETVPVDEAEVERKNVRLTSMRKRLEELKILADINDPLVKKKYEDGQGDMTKPIYRHLANKQWHAYKRPLLLQRITQMNIVPDLLPKVDPIVSTELSFPSSIGRPRKVQHGEFVLSATSEQPPILKIQSFSQGEILVTIAVVNPDVPDVSRDGFDSRIHFLACNVPISATDGTVNFAELDLASQVALPWLPAFAQKGAPYQRMSIFILEQPPRERVPSGSGIVAMPQTIDVAAMQTEGRFTAEREGFNLRSFTGRYALKPIGVDLFRTQWDEGTAGVMRRAGAVGADVEFRRKKIEPLPYKRLKGERFR